MTESLGYIGENLEFNVASASDITIYFNGGASGTKTSADDTLTEKYTDRKGAIRAYCLRSDNTVQIVSISGLDMTDPMTCVGDKGITEKYKTACISKMVIRILSDNTNIKLRVRGSEC